MRSFPRTVRRRAAAALAAAALALGVLTLIHPGVQLALAKGDLADKQRTVEKKLDRAHDDLRESSKAARAATIKLRKAEAKLADARAEQAVAARRLAAAQARDARMQAELDAAEAQLTAARQDLENGRIAVADQRDQVAGVVSSIYTQGDPHLLGLASILDAQDPADITRRLEAMDVMVGQETRAYDDLRAAEVLLVVQADSVKAAKEAVAEQRQQAADNLAVMKGLEQQAAAAAAKVAQMVDGRAEARRAAQAARRADRAEIKKLQREQARIEKMLRERARRAAQKAGNPVALPSGGYLSYPVKGYVTSQFGMRVHPIYGYRSLHDGTDFGTGRCGSPIYAADSGKVISRYYQTAFGNRLIVDHGMARGVGLATIYNHASKYVVSAGQKVKRGQVIGYVGNTGWSTGCHLHFTVMANGRPVDPMRWF